MGLNSRSPSTRWSSHKLRMLNVCNQDQAYELDTLHSTIGFKLQVWQMSWEKKRILLSKLEEKLKAKEEEKNQIQAKTQETQAEIQDSYKKVLTDSDINKASLMPSLSCLTTTYRRRRNIKSLNINSSLQLISIILPTKSCKMCSERQTQQDFTTLASGFLYNKKTLRILRDCERVIRNWNNFPNIAEKRKSIAKCSINSKANLFYIFCRCHKFNKPQTDRQ